MPSIIENKDGKINLDEVERSQNRHDELMSKEALTLSEIVSLSGLSLNSVKRRIGKIGIKPCGKIQLNPHGKAFIYTNEDAKKILSVPRFRSGKNEKSKKPKTEIFYRVSVQNGPVWIVKHAGLGIAEARRYGRDFMTLGMKVRLTGSDGKVIYMRERKNESD